MRRPSLILPLAAAYAATATAPARDPPEPVREPGATYLNEPFAAYEELARARRWAEQREWDRAAQAYQAVLDRFGRAWIRSAPPSTTAAAEAAGQVERFACVADVVIGELTAGPPELLAAYRLRYETAARRAPASYFPTSAAASAIETAADGWIESGQFGRAADALARLIDQHPDAATRGWRWRAKRAACLAWLGDRTALDALAADRAAGDEVHWLGRRQTLAEFAQRLRDIVSRPPPPAAPRTWPVFAGDADRCGAFPPTVRAEARMWRFSAFFPRTAVLPAGDAPVSQELDDALRAALASGRHLALMPAVADGRVFVCDGRSVWAVDPQSPDVPVWQFQSGPAQASESGSDWSAHEGTARLLTVTADRDAVFAAVEGPPASGATHGDAPAAREMLVRLEARSGALVWKNDMEGFCGPFEECEFDGAPLALADRLVTTVRRRKPFGFEACLVAAFSPQDGRLLWQTHVGEAATGGYGYRRPTQTFAASRGDCVFVHSNIGTIAAVRLSDGQPLWLRRYPSEFGHRGEGGWSAFGMREFFPWRYAPTMLWRDRLVVAPLDTDELFVLRQEDGEIVQRLSPADAVETLRSPESLLGIVGDRLIAAGRWLVAYDLAAGRVAWERQLPEGRLFGRGAATRDAVYLPTSEALLRYPIDGGAPQRFAWGLVEAGNVLPLGDALLVAAGQSLFGLVEKDAALSRLETLLRERPDDPAPALALAELSFQTQEPQRGLQAVDEAVRRAGGFAGTMDDRLRRRIFADCMRYAEQVTHADEGQAAPPRYDIALELLDRAGASVSDAAAQVQYRVRRAEVCLAARDYAAAVAAYQQLLSDAGLASQYLSQTGEGSVTVALYAQDCIARVIREQGRGVYAAIEEQADARLRAAERENDEAGLRAVAERYPNSLAAPRAWTSAAAMHQRRGDHAAAVRALRRAVAYRDQADRPAAIRQLCEALLAAGRRADARAWLLRGQREYPNARFTRDGRLIGFDELRRQLAADDAALDWSARPVLGGPLAEAYRRAFPAAFTILEPAPSTCDAELRSDACLLRCEDRIELIEAANGRALWPHAAALPRRPALIYEDAEQFVFMDVFAITALARADGAPRWKIGETPDEADRPETDPEAHPQWTVHAATPARLYCADNRGGIVAISLETGEVAWRAAPAPKIGTRITADDRWVVYTTWIERRNAVVLLDAATGHTARTIWVAADRPIQTLRFSDDGALLCLTATTLHALDPDAGATRWETPLHGRALASSVCFGPDSLYLSTDGARVTRFDLLTGQPRWSSPAVAQPGNDVFRAELADGIIYVNTQQTLAAVDALTGSIVWHLPDVRSVETVEPLLFEDVIITASAASGVQADDGGPALWRLRCTDRWTGRERPLALNAVEPFDLPPFDGMTARRGTLLIRRGAEIVAYVAAGSSRNASTGDSRR